MSQQTGQFAGEQGTTSNDSSRQREDASGSGPVRSNPGTSSRNNSVPNPRNQNPYLKTKIQTATPAELRLMLLDGAVKFAELGREGLLEKNYEKAFNNINRAEAIVNELRDSLKPEVDPKLCAKLNDLYLYLYLQLVKACSERSVPTIDNVIKLLKYERETWLMLMKKLDDERGVNSGGSVSSSTQSRQLLRDEIAGPAPSAGSNSQGARPAISVQG